jgi:hypothetical protein
MRSMYRSPGRLPRWSICSPHSAVQSANVNRNGTPFLIALSFLQQVQVAGDLDVHGAPYE